VFLKFLPSIWTNIKAETILCSDNIMTNLSVKMKSYLILFAFLIIYSPYCSSSDEQEFMKKYCDPSLSDEKIADLEKCCSGMPKEVRRCSNFS